MASTNRTFDVAVWCAPDERALAVDCVRRLRESQLRVVLRTVDGPRAGFGSGDALPSAAARVDLQIAGRGSAPDAQDESEGPAGRSQDPGTVTLLAPGVADAAAARWKHRVPGRVWDVRDDWQSPARWHALRQLLTTRGFAAETDIDARFALAPDNLVRATIASYDRIAEQFTEQWFDHPPERELDGFLRRLRPGSTILDAGCGPGHHAQRLSSAGHRVLGIDLSDGMLRHARKLVQSIALQKMSLERLDFSAGSFDALWCAAAILHVPRERLARVLAGFRRVLKPGGLLGLNFQVGRASELVQRGPDNRFFEYYPDAREIEARLAAAGFTVETSLHGETRRNTHALDMTLKWSTLYARALPVSDFPKIGAVIQDGLAEF